MMEWFVRGLSDLFPVPRCDSGFDESHGKITGPLFTGPRVVLFVLLSVLCWLACRYTA